MSGNRTERTVARLTITLLLVVFSGQALQAATLGVSSSPASGWLSTDGKIRFTESLQGEFQDATTVKQFKVTIKNSSNAVLYTLPASTDSGASCNATTGACVYLTNGTTYTAIKSGIPFGTYKVEGTVAVYGKLGNGSIDTNNLRGTWTTNIDYVVPKPYGWYTIVNRQNAPGLSVQSKLGTAEDTIEGHDLKHIVTDPTVKVRGDNKACKDCHAWAVPTLSKADFCNSRVTGFINSGTKPNILKDLFRNWKERGCAD